jgi:hypothetical protein
MQNSALWLIPPPHLHSTAQVPALEAALKGERVGAPVGGHRLRVSASSGGRVQVAAVVQGVLQLCNTAAVTAMLAWKAYAVIAVQCAIELLAQAAMRVR